MGIYVWGTGCGASELIAQGLSVQSIAGFVDNYPSADTFLGRPVLRPEALNADSLSLLIVTTRHADAVARTCARLAIPPEKVLYLKNCHTLSDRNAACTAAGLLPPELLERILPRSQIIPVPPALSCPTLDRRELSNDYVRLSTLELLCRRLEHVPGSAAELGVYRGFFARCINHLLPERTLYLFDSFAGFLASDGAAPAFQEAHGQITPEQVLAIQPHRSQIVLKPGFFPGSLDGLEETFCLVSLDVDFAQTTLEGLRYFWPRLNPGGYLMLHDWGSPDLPGVAQALRDYEAELGQRIPSVPLCDVGGTLVLCK